MTDHTILIAGASRGLGLALAGEFARRSWRVIATVRDTAGDRIRDLAAAHDGTVEVERLDVTRREEIDALRRRLDGRTLDILFVNAGTTAHEENVRTGTVETEEFDRVMRTNALAPMRVIETLQDLVPEDGMIGVMSSGQGSIANNTNGLRDVYRGSKAALNMFVRGFAARESQPPRSTLLLAPGWIRTDLGGDDAPYGVEDSAPILAGIMLAKRGRGGLEYLDRFGKTVPW